MIKDGRLVVAGANCNLLKARLLEIAADWLDLGSPGLSRYLMRFTPLSDANEGPSADGPIGPWQITRLNHRQTVWIIPP